jgi:hypothetical protein
VHTCPMEWNTAAGVTFFICSELIDGALRILTQASQITRIH